MKKYDSLKKEFANTLLPAKAQKYKINTNNNKKGKIEKSELNDNDKNNILDNKKQIFNMFNKIIEVNNRCLLKSKNNSTITTVFLIDLKKQTEQRISFHKKIIFIIINYKTKQENEWIKNRKRNSKTIGI